MEVKTGKKKYGFFIFGGMALFALSLLSLCFGSTYIDSESFAGALF